jgi:hypothetical protein
VNGANEHRSDADLLDTSLQRVAVGTSALSALLDVPRTLATKYVRLQSR